MIKPLTSLRFFFALFVFFSHLSFLKASVFYGKMYSEIFSEGFLGVSFFFILSGFILAYNYQDKILDRSITLRKFYLARIARIYPIHIFALLFSLPLFFVKNIKLLFLNVFLLQSYFPEEKVYFSFNAPSWSISDEMFFYLLFPFLISFIIKKNKFIKIIFSLIGLSVIFYINFYSSDVEKKYLLYISPLLRIFDFFVGILLFGVFQKFACFYKEFKHTSILEITVVILFLIFFYFHPNLDISYRYSIYYWFPMLLIILVFALSKYSEDNNKGLLSKVLSAKVLIYAGEISFCFYMMHYMMISYGSSVLSHVMPLASNTIKILFILFSTIIVSVFTYEFIEKPFNKKIKNYFT